MGENRVESKRDDTSRTENLSLEPSRFSRDLLQRFMGSGNNSRKKEFLKIEQEEEEGEGDLELSLGLSLGGRFGVDKSKLIRSSSTAACLPIVGDDDSVAANVTVCTTLVRTSSLPVETEEEWRTRKEIHSLRRLEAKRRRSEKQKNSGGGGGGGNSRGALDEKKMEIDVNWRQKLELFAAKKIGPSPCGVNALISGIDLGIGRGKVSQVGGHILPQGSVESQGGSPSSISALESNALLGTSSGSNLSNASIQSLQEGTNQDASSSALRTRTNTNKNRPSKANSGNIPRGNDTRIRDKQPETNGMRNMPCVFTKIDGPNGRRIDGILYKYGKGEEVRIMCVCHGNFLSPAEFVKHAGGSDVAHPLKHIVINPNPPT